MADVETTRKDVDGRSQRARTANSGSRKSRREQTVGIDCDDDNAAVDRHAPNFTVSDGEQTTDRKRTIDRSSSLTAIRSDSDAPLRLIVVSSKIRNSSVMHSAVLVNVVFVQYKYESATIDSCLGKFFL